MKNGLAAGAPAIAGLSLVALPAADIPAPTAPGKRCKVLCVGAHPDDPESGCAGTFAKYAAQGHQVTVVYLTRGERGIKGKSDSEAAEIRSKEAEAACQIIGAKAVFAGQVDGSADFTRPNVEKLKQIFTAEQPDIVYTHWPVDTHMDHQVASMCAIRACMAMSRRPRVYFFEVNTGSQTQGFFPNTYVDISAQKETKKNALFAHVSQDGVGIWKRHHEIVAAFRGREAGVEAAEAFVCLNREPQAADLPGTW